MSASLPMWVVPAATLNKQRGFSLSNTAGVNTPIPIVYGETQVPGQVFTLKYSSGTWTVGYVVCMGEIDAYVNTYLDGAAAKAGVTVNTYTGTTGQTADALLSAAISGYADTLVHSHPAGNIGIAYVVVQYTDTHYKAPPQLVVRIRGRKVYNPGTGTTVYSASPALALRDLITNAQFGLGQSINDTSVTNVVNDNAATVITEARRLIGLALNEAQETQTWIDILQAYAGCWAYKRGDTWQLVSDRPAASAATFTSHNIVEGSMRVAQGDTSQLPTIVRVRYTDTSTTPWREREAVAPTALPTTRRESTVRMIGVTRYTQAKREAEERLAKLARGNLSIQFQTFDDYMGLEIGDVITVTHPYGFSAATFRVTAPPKQTANGRIEVSAVAYSASDYNDTETAAPTWGAADQRSGSDTTMPEPGATQGAPPLANMLPIGYSDNETTVIDQYALVGGGSIALDTAQKYTGSQSLKVTGVTGNGSTWGVEFAYQYRVAGNLFLPAGRRWLVVAALRANQYAANSGLKFGLKPDIGSELVAASAQTLTQDTWVVKGYIIDATASSDTQFVLTLKQTNSGLLLGTPIVHVDAIRLLDVTDSTWITATSFPGASLPSVGSLGLASTTLPGQVKLATDTEAAAKASATVALTPANLPVIIPQMKVKLADTARTSQATVLDDPDLAGFTVKANQKYVLRARLRVNVANATPDFRYVWQFSQTPQVAGAIRQDDLAAAWSAFTLTTEQTRNSSGADNYLLDITARIQGHATLDATMDFQWSQQNNDATNATTLKEGSFMELVPA